MSEYETATLALAQAQLALAQTRVGIMQSQVIVAQAQVWVAALVGLVQCSLIGWGLWMMRGASKQRDVQLAQQAEQFAEIGQALRQQGRALEELLRRSTPPPPPSQRLPS